MSYKVVIIDDEPLARQLIAAYLQDYPDMIIAAQCGDGFEGFKSIQQHHPDLVFLDVQMPRLTGFEMLELLETAPSVIFTTAFDEYALKAFETHAVDYLLKPIIKERFDKALQKWLQAAPAREQPNYAAITEHKAPEVYQHRIVVKDNGTLRIIPETEILYLEANDDYVNIYTQGNKYLKKSTLSQIEQSLDPQQFVRIHRSYLIPVNQLSRIEPYEKDSHIALLRCGAKLGVSKAGMTKLKSILGW
jgi:two-component system, LytTR family, response regulator